MNEYKTRSRSLHGSDIGYHLFRDIAQSECENISAVAELQWNWNVINAFPVEMNSSIISSNTVTTIYK